MCDCLCCVVSLCFLGVSSWVLSLLWGILGFRFSTPPLGCGLSQRGLAWLKIHQRGVQWKQGVVIYMLLYSSLLHVTTPIHCTPLPLHPSVMHAHWPRCARKGLLERCKNLRRSSGQKANLRVARGSPCSQGAQMRAGPGSD